jgi:hypothetical protein
MTVAGFAPGFRLYSRVADTIPAMKTYIAVALLLCCSLIAVGYGEKRSYEYQTGKLIDVSTDEQLYEGTSYRRAIFTVQVGDLIYTTRGERVAPSTKDITRGLIVGDPVKVFEDGDHLFLWRPDGKELKTTIIKKTRAQ